MIKRLNRGNAIYEVFGAFFSCLFCFLIRNGMGSYKNVLACSNLRLVEEVGCSYLIKNRFFYHSARGHLR